ncbi:unnamed protein product, partial [Rotaria sp. Silwood1]
MDLIYVVSIVGGLLGGLVTILRLIVPIAVRLFHSINFHRRRHQSNIHDRQLARHEGKQPSRTEQRIYL